MMRQITLGLGALALVLGFNCAQAQVAIVTATTAGNGNLPIPVNSGNVGAGAFSASTYNAGGPGTVEVEVDSGGVSLPATLEVCQTNSSGTCLSPPSSALSMFLGQGAEPTFSVYVFTHGVVPYTSNVYLRIKSVSGSQLGVASVKVWTVHTVPG